jgi:cytochrome P450
VLNRVIDEIVQKRKAIPVEEQHEDFLKHMLSVTDDDSGTKFTETDIKHELFTILFAGHDTSSITLSYALYLISQHPHVEKKIFDEVDSILSSDGNPRHPTYEEVTHKLTYCNAVFKETLRLFPPAPMTTRTLTQPMQMGEYQIPAGVHAWIPIWVAQRSACNWENPEQFQPERFIDTIENNTNLFSFSGGPRICIGMKFALMEVKKEFQKKKLLINQ